MAKEPEKLQAIGLPHILGDINGGKLIPTSAIIKILKQAIGIAPAEESPELQFAMEVDAPPKASSQVARRVVLVDGFPRKLDQAEAAGDEVSSLSMLVTKPQADCAIAERPRYRPKLPMPSTSCYSSLREPSTRGDRQHPQVRAAVPRVRQGDIAVGEVLQ